jgi:hypothetical protein
MRNMCNDMTHELLSSTTPAERVFGWNDISDNITFTVAAGDITLAGAIDLSGVPDHYWNHGVQHTCRSRRNHGVRVMVIANVLLPDFAQLWPKHFVEKRDFLASIMMDSWQRDGYNYAEYILRSITECWFAPASLFIHGNGDESQVKEERVTEVDSDSDDDAYDDYV